jgi:hypothetical protein
LRNGLKLEYFDNQKGVFAQSLRPTGYILDSCTYKLPPSSFSLQAFMRRPPGIKSGKSPNEVISSQSNCPSNITLDEYKAVCTIPLGYCIQWQNILVQLSIPSVDFKKTNLLIMQTIHQAGPQSGTHTERDGHTILTDEKFGLVLLEQLQVRTESVKKNWEASRVIAIFIQFATKLLSLATSERVKARCSLYLATVRSITFNWVNKIRKGVQNSNDRDQRMTMFSKIVEIALNCVNTFDVENNHLVNLLTTPTEASIFIQSCITIQEHSSTSPQEQDPLRFIMLERWEKLSVRACEILKLEILANHSGFSTMQSKKLGLAMNPEAPGNH